MLGRLLFQAVSSSDLPGGIKPSTCICISGRIPDGIDAMGNQWIGNTWTVTDNDCPIHSSQARQAREFARLLIAAAVVDQMPLWRRLWLRWLA